MCTQNALSSYGLIILIKSLRIIILHFKKLTQSLIVEDARNDDAFWVVMIF